MSINSEMAYDLPIQINSNDINVKHISVLPSFIKFKFPTYSFKPKLVNEIGIF